MTDVKESAAEAVEAPPAPDLEDYALYFNRELSWLEFNARVLELAEDASVPLLERVKFCAIYSLNLDEFFMVRVAGLHDQVEAGLETPLQDGRTPAQTIAAIRATVRSQLSRPDPLRASTTCARRWRSTASASSPATRSTPRSAPSSTSASGARSSPC